MKYPASLSPRILERGEEQEHQGYKGEHYADTWGLDIPSTKITTEARYSREILISSWETSWRCKVREERQVVAKI